jgi:hypothetical protein
MGMDINHISSKGKFCNTSSEHTHETSRVGLVSADLAINLDVALHEDGLHFTVGKSILQSVPEDEDQGKALPGLVRTRRWLGGLKQRKFKYQITEHKHLT